MAISIPAKPKDRCIIIRGQDEMFLINQTYFLVILLTVFRVIASADRLNGCEGSPLISTI